MTEVGQPEVGDALREQYERQGRPVYSTARLWDDGMIDPRDTRDVLAQALAACAPGAARPSATASSGCGKDNLAHERSVFAGVEGRLQHPPAGTCPDRDLGAAPRR